MGWKKCYTWNFKNVLKKNIFEILGITLLSIFIIILIELEQYIINVLNNNGGGGGTGNYLLISDYLKSPLIITSV